MREMLRGNAARERRIAAGRNELRRAAMRGDAECIPNAASETVKQSGRSVISGTS